MMQTSSYLLSNHEFFTEYISCLVRKIRSHCATKTYPVETNSSLGGSLDATLDKLNSGAFNKDSYQLKETSVNEAKATPPTIGTREETTHREGLCVIRLKKVK